MIAKCTCGRWTDYGITCVSCSVSKGISSINPDEIDIESLIELQDSEPDESSLEADTSSHPLESTNHPDEELGD